VPRALVDWLMDRSRGVPLFALSLLRALLEEDADLGRPVLRELPEDLSQRILARLARLDRGDRSTLELIAVLGYRARIRDLATLTGSADAELTGALDRLVHVRLLTQDEHGWDLRFEVTHRSSRKRSIRASVSRAGARYTGGSPGCWSPPGARHGRAPLRPLGRCR
jgi:predicted ATPase